VVQMKEFIPKSIMPFARLANYCIHGRLDYNEGGLATQNRADFQRDERFIKAYETALKHNSAAQHTEKWKAHVICWAMNNAMALGGDMVECGVSRGFHSRVGLEYTGAKNKLYLIDAWDGRLGYKDEYQQVKASFSGFPNVELIRGEIPGILNELKTKKIAYLHVDLNVAKPEIEALEYLWDRMQTGAIIVSHDYGHLQLQETRKAWDKFAASKGKMVLALPTGQGVIIR